MGKKSTRGKEKKMKRRQEMEEEAAMIKTKQVVVDAANNTDDPLNKMPAFKTYDRNGQNLSIECRRVKDLTPETVDWMFDLTRDNMQKLYEDAGWGWVDKDKRDEMTEDSAWHLVVRDVARGNRPVACVHFRFDMDEGDAVLYCYEIQLVKEVRRKGLGKFLMKILELLAFQNQMEKVMLTVFKENKSANKFFRDSLGYVVDETSPEATVEEALFDEEGCGYTYEIISKMLPSRKKKQPLSQSTAANTTATAITS